MARKKICSVTQINDLSYFQELAENVVRDLPKNLRDQVKNIVLRIENFPTQAVLDELTLQSKYDLLGLYKGIPLPIKQKNNQGLPDTIYLYRAPLILHAHEHKEPLSELVYHVMIHEIGHHFGFSEQDMSWIRNHKDKYEEIL